MFRSTANYSINMTYYDSVDELRETKDFQNMAYKGLWEPIGVTHQHEFLDTYRVYLSPGLSHEAQRIGSKVWSRYKLSPLPGCSAVVVSSDSYIGECARGYGLGDHFHKERLKLARDYNSSVMICTVSGDNVIEKKILLNNGWKMIHVFHNKHTDHEVEMWLKDL